MAPWGSFTLTYFLCLAHGYVSSEPGLELATFSSLFCRLLNLLSFFRVKSILDKSDKSLFLFVCLFSSFLLEPKPFSKVLRNFCQICCVHDLLVWVFTCFVIIVLHLAFASFCLQDGPEHSPTSVVILDYHGLWKLPLHQRWLTRSFPFQHHHPPPPVPGACSLPLSQ